MTLFVAGIVGFLCDFCLVIKLAKQARRGAAALLVVECLLLAALLLLRARRRAVYVRHRSALVAGIVLIHTYVSAARLVFGRDDA